MKVLITRPRAQADEFAKKLLLAGFEPIYFPVIEIHPIASNAGLLQALQNLHNYAWVVFTSVNAVEAVFGVITRRETLQQFPGCREPATRFAAIGPKTAEALRKHHIEPDFVPEEYVAEAILPGLGDLQDKWVLLPRAEIARKALPKAICEAGGIAHEIAVYKTLPAQPNPDGIAGLKSGVDVVTLTSPSTVQNFIAIAKQNGLDPSALPNNPLFACIGPITEQAAREEGLTRIIVAKEYTTEGLMELIKDLEDL